LSQRGIECGRVVVSSSEVPEELLERADLVLDGPPAMAAFLAQLVDATSAAAS
jgi:hypothetical protein